MLSRMRLRSGASGGGAQPGHDAARRTSGGPLGSRILVYGIRRIRQRCRAHQHSPRPCTDRGALYGLRRVALRRDGARRSDCAYSGTFGTRTGLRPVRHSALRSGALRCDQAFEYVRHHFNHLVTSFCGPAFRAPLAVAFPAFSPFRRALPGWLGMRHHLVAGLRGAVCARRGGWWRGERRRAGVRHAPWTGAAASPGGDARTLGSRWREHGVRGSSRSSLAGVRWHRGLCPGEAPFDVRPHRLVATRRRVDARGRSPVFSRRIHGSERRSVVRQCGDGNRCVRMYVSVFSGSGAVVREKYRVSYPAIPGFLSVWRVAAKLRSRRSCGVQASNAVRIRATSCH